MVNPKYAFWLGIIVTVCVGVGGGTVHLTNALPEAWIPAVIAWNNLIGFAGTATMTAMAAVSSRQAGPFAKAAIIAAAVTVCAEAVPSAYAADMPPAPPSVKAVTVMPVSFSGFYFGINGAVAKTDGKFEFLAVPGTGELRPSGAMAGVTAGFGAWVNGLFIAAEADGDYDWTKQGVTCGGTGCVMKSAWALNQRAVIGWALGSLTGQVADRINRPAANWPVPLALPDKVAAANVMPFLTAGIAERRFEACVSGSCGREWIAGPVFGGGLRVPVSANFSVGATYLHAIYNKHFTPADGVALLGANFKATTEDSLMLHLLGHF